MHKFILRRLAILPIALVLIHFLGFTYAYVARPIRAARTPYLREQVSNPAPLLETYKQYIQDIFNGSLLKPPEKGPQIGSFAQDLWQACIASMGLLAIVISLSILLGVALGLLAVRNQPPGVRRWLIPLSTIGLAMPSFYVGSLGILAVVYLAMSQGPTNVRPFPIRGFGWDNHLILPVIALMLRPTVQIAQVTAGLLAGELGKQYVIAARSFGHTWRDIRWRQAMRNTLAAVILSIAGSFRQLVGELVVVEWLFSWPGLGKLLASTLVPGLVSTNLGSSALFLDPPTVAAAFTIIGALFLMADLLASVLVRVIDPRLRSQGEAAMPGGLEWA
jgi:ABC-type dipeptide/oligopeptide/nickel transport system permease component